ncbi:hypothetical protein D3C73_1552340 [compost metagenome]
MNLTDVKFIGGKIGNGFNVFFVGIEALNQRHANNHFFSGSGQFFQILQHASGVAVSPLLKRRIGDVF